MTGAVTSLLARVSRDAAEEGERRRQAGSARASTIVDAARHRATHRRMRALEALGAEQAADEARVVAQADATAAGGLLRARHALVDEVLDDAVGRFPAVAASEGYPDALRRWIGQCRPFLPDGVLHVRCAAPAMAAAQRLAAADPTLRVSADPDLADGVVLVSEDGRVRVDGSWRRARERDRPRLATAILHALPAGPTP